MIAGWHQLTVDILFDSLKSISTGVNQRSSACPTWVMSFCIRVMSPYIHESCLPYISHQCQPAIINMLKSLPIHEWCLPIHESCLPIHESCLPIHMSHVSYMWVVSPLYTSHVSLYNRCQTATNNTLKRTRVSPHMTHAFLYTSHVSLYMSHVSLTPVTCVKQRSSTCLSASQFFSCKLARFCSKSSRSTASNVSSKFIHARFCVIIERSHVCSNLSSNSQTLRC
jgi:hypothetical protein